MAGTSERGKWRRVTRAEPCPICQHSDWCSISSDGTVAKCQRVDAGCYRSKTDRTGAPYYLHRLDGAARPESPPRPSGVPVFAWLAANPDLPDDAPRQRDLYDVPAD
jgi:hypothetical protein